MKLSLSRRDFLKKAGLTAGATTLALGSGWRVLGQGTLNIVLLLPQSGSFAGPGGEAIRGAQLVLDGAEAGGRAVNLIVEDTATDPSTGLEKAEKVLADDDVDFVIGPISSAVTAAMRDRVLQSRAIWFIPTTGAGASPTVEGLCSPQIFAGVNTFALSNAFGPWVKENVADEVYIFVNNYVFGNSTAAQFRAGFEAAGGTIVGEGLPPLGTSDFASFLTPIINDQPQALFTFVPGSNGINFVKQFEEFGLKENTKLTGLGSSFVNLFLPAMGSAAVGAFSSLNYGPEDTSIPANVEFRDAYAAAYGRPTGPSFYAMMAYDFARTALAVTDQLSGDTSNVAAVVDAIENLELDSPRGPLSYSATHDPITNIYVRETQAQEGDAPPLNIVVDTIPNVEVPVDVAVGGPCDLS